MKEYVLTEAELETISLLNTLSSGFFSAASGAFLFTIGLYSSAAMQGTLSEKAFALLQFGGVTGSLLAIVFALAGFLALHKKRSKLSDIQRQSMAIDQTNLATNFQSTQFTPSTSDKGDPQKQ